MITIQKNTNTNLLDLSFNYSFENVYTLFDELGDIGRSAYIDFIIEIDLWFPFAYGVLLFIMSTFFTQRLYGQKVNYI